MDPHDEFALEEVAGEFAGCPRQHLVRDPRHCDECAAAEEYLQSLDRSDLRLGDISDRAGFDYFSMISDEGYLYFLPAFCRIALRERPGGLSHLLLRLGRAHAVVADPAQRSAIIGFLEYLNSMNYVDGDSERRELRMIRERLSEKWQGPLHSATVLRMDGQ